MLAALRAFPFHRHCCLRRLVLPTLLRRMSAQSQASRVRAAPDSDVELPEAKKARLASGTPPTIVQDDVSPPAQAKGVQLPKMSKRKHKHKRPELPEPCSAEDVLWHEIKSVLGTSAIEKATEEGAEFESPFTFHQEVEVVVKSLSPSGEAVAIPTDERFLGTPWAIVVPFSLPGEVVRAKVYRNARMHSFADLVQVVTPNLDLRDDSRVRCRYFGRCAGCQYQMLSYDSQLSFKRDVIVKAYRNFSGLSESSVPTVLPTIGSPLQYGYRTKITPHFEAASKTLRKQKQEDNDALEEQPEWLKIGFNVVGTRKVLDIEECPIATPVINEALTVERANIIQKAYTYKRGVSLILRDSLDPTIPLPPETSDPSSSEVENYLSEALSKHVCVTSHTAKIREEVGGFIFEYPASSFFQNNNSVLVPLTHYVKEAIFPPGSKKPRPTHLVDTYCGSGLFAITLSPHFETISGIELSTDSIRSAQQNVTLNNSLRAVPAFNTLISSTSTISSTIPTVSQPDISFRSGTASDIFSSVSSFPRQDTVIVIDPPRKGCDDEFIRQVVKFRPAVLVYVSCNVHTQARDIGKLLKMVDEVENAADDSGGDNEKRGNYVLESLRGFDLFPQTGHVESVAVLRLI